MLVDPYLTRLGFLRQWVGTVHPDRERIRSAVSKCDVVLVTHSHWDHLMDVPEVVGHTGAIAVGSSNTAYLLKLLGVPEKNITTVQPGVHLIVHDFNVRVFEAHHMRAPGFGPGNVRANLRPPLRARDYRMDQFFSFHVEVNGITLATEPGDRPLQMPETSILLVSPRYQRDQLVEILDRTHPKTVVPCHWDNMYRPLSKPMKPMLKPPALSLWPFRRMNLEEFRETIKRIDCSLRVFIPEVMKRYPIQELLATSND